jgi:hypothetical protein
VTTKLKTQTITEVGQCAVKDWFGEVLSLLANHDESVFIVEEEPLEEHTGGGTMPAEKEEKNVIIFRGIIRAINQPKRRILRRRCK